MEGPEIDRCETGKQFSTRLFSMRSMATVLPPLIGCWTAVHAFLERSIAFYTRCLGFRLAFRYGDFYAGVDIGGYLLHLKLIDANDPSIDFVQQGGHLHLHLTVDDICGTLEQAFEHRIEIVEGISARPWGMEEFIARDPDGHTLYFAEPLSA